MTMAYSNGNDNDSTRQITRTLCTDAYDFITTELDTTFLDDTSKHNPYTNLAYGNEPDGMFWIYADSKWWDSL
jgi:hypothetical protein